MASTADTYRSAAKEHLARAQQMFDTEQYFLAHYLSGLAVECHLRAYLRRTTDQFNSRHDLGDLAKEAGFYNIVPQKRAGDFSGKFTTLNQRWRSNHRYHSDREFLDYMTEIKAKFNVKGNRWKNLSRAVLELAHDVIKQGEAKWDSK